MVTKEVSKADKLSFGYLYKHNQTYKVFTWDGSKQGQQVFEMVEDSSCIQRFCCKASSRGFRSELRAVPDKKNGKWVPLAVLERGLSLGWQAANLYIKTKGHPSLNPHNHKEEPEDEKLTYGEMKEKENGKYLCTIKIDCCSYALETSVVNQSDEQLLTINSNACDFNGCCTSLPKWGFDQTVFNIYEGLSHSGKMKGKITRF